MSRHTNRPIIPESELQIDFVRASGAGGQNVNKVSTKVQLRWNVDQSPIFSPEEKAKIKVFLANRINEEGEVVMSSQETRSQLQNKERVVERLHELVEIALRPVHKRIPTKPTRGSRERRLEFKEKQSQRKQSRRKVSLFL
ncbi:MAG: alternative ribosome rescue aminoacyl-tRNA hydrolase ArfB [Patescibacteria group bacterium]